MSSSPHAAPTQVENGPASLSRSESYRWIVLGVAVAAQTTASVVSQGIYTLVPFWQSAFGLSQASTALAITAMNGGQILSMLLLGWAIDRYGERSVVALTMILMSLVALGAAGLASSYATLLVFLIGLGACYASVQPGGTRAIMRWFPPNLRGMATGVRQAGLPLGTALAAMTLPLLALHYGWRAAVCVQAAVGIVGGLLFGIFHRDDVGQVTSGKSGAVPSIGALLKMLANDAALWPILLAGVAMVTFQYTFATHVLTFLSNDIKISIVTASFIFAVAQGFGIVGRISLAWISDHLWPGKRPRSLGWTMAACALAVGMLTLLPAQTPIWLLLAVFAVVGFLGIGWYPLWLVQVAEMAPKAAMASTVSFAMTLNMIAISVMPPVFGLVVDFWGYASGWLLLATPLVLSAIQLCRLATTTGEERTDALRTGAR
jgi:MFS family permease